LNKGLFKGVFDHIRNFLICAFLFALGTNELKQQTVILFGLLHSNYSGTGII